MAVCAENKNIAVIAAKNKKTLLQFLVIVSTIGILFLYFNFFLQMSKWSLSVNIFRDN